MQIEKLNFEFTVCKVSSIKNFDFDDEFYFISKTDEEISLVCKTEKVPAEIIIREDGWKGFRITGILDFSLIGILAKISALLAENKIGIFAISTYNTDYILVKQENFSDAINILGDNGYSIK